MLRVLPRQGARSWTLGAALALGLGGWLWGIGGGPVPTFGFGGPLPGDTGSTIKRNRTPKIGYAPSVVLVAYQPGATAAQRFDLERRYGLTPDPDVRSPYFVRYFMGPATFRIVRSEEQLADRLDNERIVRLAELDRQVMKEQALPNDPRFGEQFGLHNTGQSGGTADADIDAPEGWQAATATGTIRIAVLDDAVEINHPDLSGNIFVNPGEVAANGIDDDGNGFVDDVRGWDFASNDNDPSPPAAGDSHGTHVAGIVAAVTDNGVGIAGTGENLRIIPVRFYAGQQTWMSDLIRGIDYARIMGARVISVSYNIDGYTQLLVDAITRAGNADIVYVNSAGNNGQQNPPRQVIRSLCSNAVFVAATDRNDNLASFSNFGSLIDIAAPGVDILSTVPYGGYANMSGTSMATPMAAAVIAVVRNNFPTLTASQVIDRVAGTAEMKPSLVGRVNGGRVNLPNSLDNDSVAPSDPGVPVLLRRAPSVLDIRFTASGDDGTSGSASRYDLRISPNPITAANFESTPAYGGALPTGTAGTDLRTQLNNLPSGTFYLALRAIDNVGNRSGIVFSAPMRTAFQLSSDNMEGAATFNSVSGNWARTTEQSVSPTRSWTDSPGAQYPNNASWSMVSAASYPITQPMNLSFMLRHALENNYDFLFFDVSADNGTTWTQLLRVTGNSGWRQVTVPLSGYVGQNLRFRFRLTSDGSVTADGVYIDDLSFGPISISYLDTMEGAARFTGDAPWALATDRAFSPVRSWTDSPAGAYGNNVNIRLRGTNDIPVAIANPSLSFRAYIDTEANYDFLDALVSTDGGTTWTARGSWSGTLTAWNLYSAPIGDASNVRIGFRFRTDGSVTDEGVWVDDAAIVGEPWLYSLIATLGLDGYAGSMAAMPMTVELRTPGTTTVVETRTVTMADAGGGNGRFLLETENVGTFDVVIRGGSYLRRVVRNMAMTGLDNPMSTTLVNGDVDRNNIIDARDVALVRRSLGATPGSPSWNPRADLDGNGAVNSNDLAICNRNQRRRGDS